MLRISAGREGESQGVHGDVEFTDVSGRPCVLRGLPGVAIVTGHGRPPPVRLARAAGLLLRPVTLRPGQRDAADLVIFWANWCGPRLGRRLGVRVTLPAHGVITGPFNGPPGYDAIPRCVSPGQSSVISVIAAYLPGQPGGGTAGSQAGPAVTLRPGSGPVGAVVAVIGSGCDPALASAPVVPLTLNRAFADGCALVGGVREIRMHVTRNGRLRGEFIITADGTCFQEPGRRHRVTPGLYHLAIGCMACNVRAFRVTA
jgi:hypothetical protein